MFGLLASVLRWAIRAAIVAAVMLALAIVYDGNRPAISTLMLGRWATFRSVDRQWVPLGAMSRNLTTAVVMSEDGQFCIHNGVDWDALHEVMSNPEGPNRGASTLTMQTAKNLFLWPGRSYIRKGLEIPLALLIDALWSKRRILEIYLNVAEWGDGIFGAEAAAQHYFNKPASRLTVREAALLATALPNPFLRNPQKPTRMQRQLAVTNMERARTAEPWVSCLR